MGFFDFWRKEEKRSLSLNDIPEIRNLLAPPMAAGVAVTHETALGISAFWRGVNCYTSTIGSLPRKVYRRTDSGREEARTHYVYPIVHKRANPHMSDQVFFELVMHHALVCGNFYAEIEFNGAAKPVAMWPLSPRQVKAYVTPDAKLFYRYTPGGGKPVDLESWRVFHVPGFGFDGYEGYSVIQIARQSLGLTLASETFGASFFGNGTWPGLVMQHPKELSSGARERIEKSLRELLRGPDKAHGLLIMEEGATAQKIAMTPEESQFLQTRQYQAEEVARWLNLPPHKVGVSVGARPGGNLESSQTEFYMDSIRPWLVRIEKEANHKLFPDGNDDYYIEHEADAILRGDSQTRYENYSKAISSGFMSPKVAAAKENLPEPEQPEPVHKDTPPDPPAPDPSRARLLALARTTMRALQRIEAVEARKAKNIATWAADFYPKHREKIAARLDGFGIDAAQFADELCRRHAEEIVAASSVEALLTGWDGEEPERLAEIVGRV